MSVRLLMLNAVLSVAQRREFVVVNTCLSVRSTTNGSRLPYAHTR